MKNIFLGIFTLLLFSCSEEKSIYVAFDDIEYTSKTSGPIGNVQVGFFNKVQWNDEEWLTKLENELLHQSSSNFATIIFNDSDNTPNVSELGMDYPLSFDKYMMAGFWHYPNGSKKFCYGGVDSSNNFNNCKEY